ncbi:hypothetical protein C8Q69DRAFT_442609 [Paecilomyces variotii]|uniref:Uncharacterized protein n=1 Tax=Byssochlamys spectabilis TaxID=264951 RepID=A0A443I334_BYSSP|nr:hypothetical protein C8Q69DRAFT_442609 [Paecilomyces variotii]RWQ98455.1 hypothetical protein C8Q69DRAFT_442609 [Paecilomyces variotii]
MKLVKNRESELTARKSPWRRQPEQEIANDLFVFCGFKVPVFHIGLLDSRRYSTELMFETSSDERGDWETWMGYSSGPRRAAIAAGLWSAAQRDIIRPLSKYKTMFSSSLLLPQFTVNGTRVIILIHFGFLLVVLYRSSHLGFLLVVGVSHRTSP